LQRGRASFRRPPSPLTKRSPSASSIARRLVGPRIQRARRFAADVRRGIAKMCVFVFAKGIADGRTARRPEVGRDRAGRRLPNSEAFARRERKSSLESLCTFRVGCESANLREERSPSRVRGTRGGGSGNIPSFLFCKMVSRQLSKATTKSQRIATSGAFSEKWQSVVRSRRSTTRRVFRISPVSFAETPPISSAIYALLPIVLCRLAAIENASSHPPISFAITKSPLPSAYSPARSFLLGKSEPVARRRIPSLKEPSPSCVRLSRARSTTRFSAQHERSSECLSFSLLGDRVRPAASSPRGLLAHGTSCRTTADQDFAIIPGRTRSFIAWHSSASRF